MEANKQLRYDLLKANQYDVEHAKACYEFIEGKEDNLPTRVEEVELPDGVYFVKRDGSVQLYTGQIFKEEEKSLYEYVGVKQGEKSLLIFCRDNVAGPTKLTTKEGGSRFIKNYHDAVADWNGKANTEDIRDILAVEALVPDDWHIPSLGEMYFILVHLKEINAALEAIGQEPLHDDWYWTSTQYSATSAWYLYLGSGYASYFTKASDQLRVRPVSAFLTDPLVVNL